MLKKIEKIKVGFVEVYSLHKEMKEFFSLKSALIYLKKERANGWNASFYDEAGEFIDNVSSMNKKFKEVISKLS